MYITHQVDCAKNYSNSFVISSECEGYVALLQASVRVLLYCLETLDAVVVAREGFFSWEVEEGVKCACSLRRIYEEVGAH